MADSHQNYIDVPVEAARQISSAYAKHVVIIVTYDRLNARTHFTTFGQSAADKFAAAKCSEMFQVVSGFDIASSMAESSEDFRWLTSATAKQIIEDLMASVSTLATDLRVAALSEYVDIRRACDEVAQRLNDATGRADAALQTATKKGGG